MIEICHATKKLKKQVVLDDINLTFDSGTVTGLKGINGSGKTMLMRLVCGLIRPDTGTVKIDGKQLHKDIDFPDSIGVLLENPAFLKDYTGSENLKLLASIKNNADDKQIADTIVRVGLEYAKDVKYRKYSLGMKQRLGIAAAILETPDIILLDEPTNSLDDAGVDMTLEIIRQEAQRGACVIWSCHDGELLCANSDVVYVIEEGRITGKLK